MAPFNLFAAIIFFASSYGVCNTVKSPPNETIWMPTMKGGPQCIDESIKSFIAMFNSQFSGCKDSTSRTESEAQECRVTESNDVVCSSKEDVLHECGPGEVKYVKTVEEKDVDPETGKNVIKRRTIVVYMKKTSLVVEEGA